MNDKDCFDTLCVLLSARGMTFPEIVQASGFAPSTVTRLLRKPPFAKVGKRRTGVRWYGITVYGIAAEPQQHHPNPLERPVNPIVAGIVHDQLDIGRMIRRLAAQGDSEAAQVLVKVWQNDDRELKRICERIEK